MKWKKGTDGEEEKRVGALVCELTSHLRERLFFFFVFVAARSWHKTKSKERSVVLMLEGI